MCANIGCRVYFMTMKDLNHHINYTFSYWTSVKRKSKYTFIQYDQKGVVSKFTVELCTKLQASNFNTNWTHSGPLEKKTIQSTR